MKSVAETSESDSDESDSEVDIFHATGRGISVGTETMPKTDVCALRAVGADELRFASPVSLHDQKNGKELPVYVWMKNVESQMRSSLFAEISFLLEDMLDGRKECLLQRLSASPERFGPGSFVSFFSTIYTHFVFNILDICH